MYRKIHSRRVDTLAYEHGSAFSRVNLLDSFRAWAELVWGYLLEVTNTINPSSIPDRRSQIVLTLTLTLALILILTLALILNFRCTVPNSVM